MAGLAVELAPNAHANAVAPTWMRTPLYRALPASEVDATERQFGATIPLGRTATTDEVAAAYLHLVRSPFTTGQTLVVDGGLTLVE